MRHHTFPLFVLALVLSWVSGQAQDPFHAMDFKPARAFVYAPSGLNLRAEPTANGTKLATVGMGAEVEVLAPPSAEDMTVDNLKGGMVKVKFDGKEGYMFSGYLCRAPLPEAETTAEKYVEVARGLGLEMYYEEIHRDYGGYFQAEYAIVVDGLGWQEAFLLGKALFTIPKGLNFPARKGKDTVTEKNPQAHPQAWTDELSTEYGAEGEIRVIRYSYRAEATGQVVSVEYNEQLRGLRISELQIAD